MKIAHWIQNTRTIFKYRNWSIANILRKSVQFLPEMYDEISHWRSYKNILRALFLIKSFQVSKITEQNSRESSHGFMLKLILTVSWKSQGSLKRIFDGKTLQFMVENSYRFLDVRKKSDALNAQNSTKGLWTEKRRGPLNFRASGRRGWPNSKTRA